MKAEKAHPADTPSPRPMLAYHPKGTQHENKFPTKQRRGAASHRFWHVAGHGRGSPAGCEDSHRMRLPTHRHRRSIQERSLRGQRHQRLPQPRRGETRGTVCDQQSVEHLPWLRQDNCGLQADSGRPAFGLPRPLPHPLARLSPPVWQLAANQRRDVARLGNALS